MAPPDHLDESRIVGERVPRFPRRPHLGDDAVAIGDQYRLAGSGETDVLAQAVVQLLDPDGSHGVMVATVATHRNGDRIAVAETASVVAAGRAGQLSGSETPYLSPNSSTCAW